MRTRSSRAEVCSSLAAALASKLARMDLLSSPLLKLPLLGACGIQAPDVTMPWLGQWKALCDWPYSHINVSPWAALAIARLQL